MRIKDIMTKNVITLPSSSSIGETQKVMKDHKIRRVPVVDDGKLVGIVTEGRLERVTPTSGTPLLWQIGYLVSHTTLKDVMIKDPVTIDPDATIEQGVALAQSKKVGALIVVEDEKVVGIVTTNDFFYRVLNPALGIGMPGTRIIIPGCADGSCTEKIVAIINKLGVPIKMVFTMLAQDSGTPDLVLHLDTEDASGVIKALGKAGFHAAIRAR